MLDTFEMTGELDADLIPDESLLQYMVRMGTPTRVLDMADAIFANDYGNEASKIGLKEVAHEQDQWKHGEVRHHHAEAAVAARERQQRAAGAL